MPTAALIGPLSVRRDEDVDEDEGFRMDMDSNMDGNMTGGRGRGRSKDAFICPEDVLIFYPAELAANRK